MRRILPVLGLAALVACRTVAPLPEATRGPAPALRLAPDVRPVQQSLDLVVDPDQPRFSGSTKLQVVLPAPTDRIRLHGRGLHVTRAAIVRGGRSIAAEWIVLDEEEGVAEVRAAEPVGGGEISLELAWDAAWDEQVAGLYRVKDGDRWYAFTQFEPVFARRAFPCFDEPGFKIPFRVSVTSPAGAIVAGNSLVASDEARGAAHLVTFASTPPLPTYLVALAVGPFDVVAAPDLPASAVRAKPLPLRAIATKGKGAQLAYALAKTGGLVQALEEWFGIAYPYDKLDLVAVPDFAAGAMENAGLITFREWLLLVDGDRAPVDQRRAMASTVSHELSHQWFGNLVTMQWWDDLWLNEAFASWIGERIVAAWDPSSREELVLLEDIEGAMELDSLVSARQIRQPIVTTHDVHNAFDGITYDKGAGVIGMFERWVGREAFRKGVRGYLEEHRFGNATAADFLAAVGAAAGRDVGTPMRTFLEQPGVPLLDVALDCAKAPVLHVRQSRSLPLRSTGDAARTWQVPVCVRWEEAGASAEKCELISQPQQDVTLGKACPTWLHPNADGAGYYRFRPDPAALAALSKAGAKLTLSEQLALADSLQAAVAAGTLPFGDVLSSLAALVGSPDRRVASAAFGLVEFARTELVSAPVRPKVEAWGVKLVAPRQAELTFAPMVAGDPEAALYRKEFLRFAIFTAQDGTLRAEASKLGRAWLGVGGDGRLHEDVVDATFADLVLNEAVRAGDTATFDAVLAHLRAATDPGLRRRLLTALAWAPHDLATRTRELLLGADVRPSELYYLLGPQAHRVETRAALWLWIEAHFDALVAKLPEEFAGDLPWYAADLCSDEAATQVEAFLAPRIDALPGGPRNLAATLERMRLCAAQVAAHRPAAEAFFSR